MESDSELVRLTLDGRRDSFAVLVERYERSVLAVARSVLPEAEAAQDASQEAFMAAYTKLGSLKDGKLFGPWIIQIARRAAIRMARQKKRLIHCASDDQLSSLAARTSSDEMQESLLQAVMKVPDSERTILMLRHFEGLSIQEIVQVTGRPVGTITKLLSRAHHRLRNELRQWND